MKGEVKRCVRGAGVRREGGRENGKHSLMETMRERVGEQRTVGRKHAEKVKEESKVKYILPRPVDIKLMRAR